MTRRVNVNPRVCDMHGVYVGLRCPNCNTTVIGRRLRPDEPASSPDSLAGRLIRASENYRRGWLKELLLEAAEAVAGDVIEPERHGRQGEPGRAGASLPPEARPETPSGSLTSPAVCPHGVETFESVYGAGPQIVPAIRPCSCCGQPHVPENWRRGQSDASSS